MDSVLTWLSDTLLKSPKTSAGEMRCSRISCYLSLCYHSCYISMKVLPAEDSRDLLPVFNARHTQGTKACVRSAAAALAWKCLSFLDISRAQDLSKITENNSQGIVFVIISCQRVTRDQKRQHKPENAKAGCKTYFSPRKVHIVLQIPPSKVNKLKTTPHPQ